MADSTPDRPDGPPAAEQTNTKPLTPDVFRRVMSLYATGITVVTTHEEDGTPHGLTVNSFASVSLEPLLVSICLDNRLRITELLQNGRTFGVSILTDDQEDVSAYFARRSAHYEPRFRIGQTGVPLVEDTLANLECEVVAVYPGGDHTIYLGEVKWAYVSEDADQLHPLIFYHRKYCKLAR